MNLDARAQRLLDRRIVNSEPLAGGDICEVRRLILDDGASLVAKSTPHAHLEARMLADLALADAPVPKVISIEGDLLIMTDLGGRAGLAGPAAAEEAGRRLALLHSHVGDRFGYEYDTVIGPLPQDNRPCDDWPAFYAERRLLTMARMAKEAGRLPIVTLRRIERLSGNLDRWLAHRPAASLVHGDFWSGNVVSVPDRLCGFIDPAIYRGDSEMDLAMLALFGGLNDAFLRGYGSVRRIASAFFEKRMALYQLWPLLVHVRLFGGGYLTSVERILARYDA
ncbi:MAG: hypothetical protein D6757_00215 [Alphaproteobacteria bacterium]|nr:MAG: hypothetical protein D6757_00215 [Alphaproteobacteria bacterium]